MADEHVHVYRNKHKHCWSIRKGGRVIGHSHHLLLLEPEFRVQQAGRMKVALGGHKNVHAYVKGIVCERPLDPYYRLVRPQRRIRYQPTRMRWFELEMYTDTGTAYCPITSLTGIVEFREDGSLWLIAAA